MTDLANECLEVFPKWLESLGEDAVALASLLSAESIPETARRLVAGSLNYLSKSLDLIPDGVEDLGYLDDAFVVRVAAKLAVDEVPGTREADIRGVLAGLAEQADLIEKLLEDDYPRLVKYVRTLEKGAARGRAVDDIVGDSSVRGELVREVQVWSKSYETPSFTRDEQTLIKLKSFLSAKLP